MNNVYKNFCTSYLFKSIRDIHINYNISLLDHFYHFYINNIFNNLISNLISSSQQFTSNIKH